MPETKPKPGIASCIRRPLLAGMVAAGATLPAPAAADVFLKLDGIPGESRDSKHKDEIDILSYTQSFRQIIASPAAGGGATGKVNCGDVTVLKNIDKSSPRIIQAVTTGQVIPKAEITFRTVGGNEAVEYYKVTLSQVLIAAIDQTDQPDPSRIVERVQLNAAKFEFEYRQQGLDGKLLTGSTITFGFDCRKNEKF